VPDGDLSCEEWKSQMAAQLDLDLMIDDAPEVLNAMPTKTKRLWLCDPAIFNLESCISAMKADTRIGVIR
jgi:hypothetical protein